MGMGEPLENYDAVSSAVRGFVDPLRFGLAPSSVCLDMLAFSAYHSHRNDMNIS